jgi:hypothetical protein
MVAAPSAPVRTTSKLDQALSYEQMGFSVIPENRDKKPYIAWTRFQEQRATPAQIREWWQRWPDANIGIIAGAVSGIFVLESDNPAALAEMEQAGYILPPTRTEQARRGPHYFFKHPGFPVRNIHIFPEIEIKGDKGKITGAGSTHKTGHIYTVSDDLPIVEAPAWLIEKITPAPPKVHTPARLHATSDQQRAYAVAGLEAEAATLAATSINRNDQLFRSVAAAASFIPLGLLTESEIEGVLKPIARNIGLTEFEINGTFKSGIKNGMGNPRDLAHLEHKPVGLHQGHADQPKPGQLSRTTILINNESADLPLPTLAVEGRLTLGAFGLIRWAFDQGAALALTGLAITGDLVEGQIVDMHVNGRAAQICPNWQPQDKTFWRGMRQLEGTFLEVISEVSPSDSKINTESDSKESQIGEKIGKQWRITLTRGVMIAQERARYRVEERTIPPDPDQPLRKSKPAMYTALGLSPDQADDFSAQFNEAVQPVLEAERPGPRRAKRSTMAEKKAKAIYHQVIARFLEAEQPRLPGTPIHDEADLIDAYAWAYARQDARKREDEKARVANSTWGDLFNISKPTARKMQARLGAVEEDTEWVDIPRADAIEDIARQEHGVIYAIRSVFSDGSTGYVKLGDPVHAVRAAKAIESRGDKIQGYVQRANKITLADAPAPRQRAAVKTEPPAPAAAQQTFLPPERDPEPVVTFSQTPPPTPVIEPPPRPFLAYRPKPYFGDGYNPDYVFALMGQAVYKLDQLAGRDPRALNHRGQLVNRVNRQVIIDRPTFPELYALVVGRPAATDLDQHPDGTPYDALLSSLLDLGGQIVTVEDTRPVEPAPAETSPGAAIYQRWTALSGDARDDYHDSLTSEERWALLEYRSARAYRRTV